MAVIWRGGAVAVAQVDTVQVTGYHAATTYTLTINGRTVSVLGDTDENTTAANLSTAWNNSTITEFAEITASVATDTITLTCDTAGVPFTCTSSVAGGTGTIGAVTSSTANSGPNAWDTDTNWIGGSVPGGDDVVFERSSVSCLYGLDQSNAITSLTIKASFTGYLGLSRNNDAGYVEYRPTALTTSTAITAIAIGEGSGFGSGRIKISMGNLTANLNIDVHKTGTAAESGIPVFLLTTGTQSQTTTLTANKGVVGVAIFAGESAVIKYLNVGYVNSVIGDADVMIGSGVTLDTTTKTGGVVDILCNSTTIINNDGTVTISGTATVATLNLRGGTGYYNSSGTAETIDVNGGATLDFRRDGRARIVTNLNIYEGGAIFDPAATVTWTNGLDLENCGLGGVTLDLGEHRTWTPTAID